MTQQVHKLALPQDMAHSNLSEADKAFIAQNNLEIARQLLQAVENSLDRRNRTILDQLGDLRALLIGQRAPANTIKLVTDYPVAYQSNDHVKPRGTKDDNTRSMRFVRAVENHFGRPVSALDLGCAGGGLVFDFLVRGHRAFGLEGSDYSIKSQRAEWRVIGDYLDTCDITKPFKLLETGSGKVHKFDVVTMWEVLEHIQESDLPQLFANVKAHLAPGGIFVGSAATYDDIANGVSYHPTVKPESWWQERVQEFGLQFIDKSMFSFGDFVRGSGNIHSYYDANFDTNPELGFHFVMTHVDKKPARGRKTANVEAIA
ncbi:MAG: methyltransferase [Beijerinckiaceae bacterium]|nr:methyltransferase [Beijerinckiaceae bacterium]